ncbi:MAG: HAD family phosphatase [Lachnospiraceae bacterium]|nr:HAD family phosphatase [Lachnospiraceae bacterium]
MGFSGAIFDMDGVLFDTERLYQQTWHELAKECGVQLGSGFLQAITGTSGAHMHHMLEEYYHVSDGAALAGECMGRMREKLSVRVPVKKGVREILGFFKEQGIPIAIASSSLPQQIEANLQKSELRSFFSEVVSGTEVEHGKPAPDIFLRAAGRLMCRPQECFVFEDSENGVKAGYAAGCATIMVPDLIEPSPAILKFCTRVCTDLLVAREEVLGILNKE